MDYLNKDKVVNRLLAALPPEEYQNLSPYIEQVELPQGKIIYQGFEECDYAYFPGYAIISIVAIMDNGSTTEIGVVGNEGMVGLPIVLGAGFNPTHTVVQVGGGGYRLPADILKAEFDRQGMLYRLLMRYVQARLVQVGQTAACNRHHNLEQRFARWLLMVRYNLQRDEFYLTQEFIAQMLGVRRTGVTEVASKFQKLGIISYKRGLIQIIDVQQLEISACECYELITGELDRLLN